jgi:hypothetical protein
MSSPAQLLGKLDALAKTDTAAFKTAVEEIAGKLRDAAKATSDPNEEKALTDLAAGFTEAAKTGNTSSLKPPQGPPPGGPPPGGPPPAGGAGGASSSTSKTYDPADSNEDGVVSAQEQAAYDAKQAALGKEQSNALGAYRRTMHTAADAKVDGVLNSILSVVDAFSSVKA